MSIRRRLRDAALSGFGMASLRLIARPSGARAERSALWRELFREEAPPKQDLRARVMSVRFRTLGFSVLYGGIALSLFLFALLQALAGGWLGFLVATPVAISMIALARALIRGAAALEEDQSTEERGDDNESIVKLSRARRGLVRARDVSAALRVPLARADALLTELAKSNPDHVAVEIDEASGALVYRVDTRRMRVESEPELLEEEDTRAERARARFRLERAVDDDLTHLKAKLGMGAWSDKKR